jgi:hypothetical protein
MIIASTPPAIITRQVDSTLDARGGVIQIPTVEGVSAQLIYPANDMPAAERVHIEATGPIGIKRLGAAPFGGNNNYTTYYQLRIMPSGPATVVHFFGAPKLILDVSKPIATVDYGLQATVGNYNLQMGATGDSSEPHFDLANVRSIFKNGVLTIDLRNSTLVLVISTIQLAATIKGRVEDALGKLETYKLSRSLDDLQTAIYAMQQSLDVDLFRANAFTFQRRAFVSGWAQVLRSIEDAYDPRFDPDEHLPCPLPRPGEPQGTLFPVVCDPKLIGEPYNDAVRNRELQDLERYRVSYEHYRGVKRLDDESMTTLEMSINLLSEIAPAGTPSDYLALDHIFLDSAISDSRRIKIEAMLRDPSLGYITLPGQAVRGLNAALAGALVHLDNVTLASQQVEVGISHGKINIVFARDHHGNILSYQVDTQTGAVLDLKQVVPFSFESNGLAMSALDAKALILLYNKLLSGALDVLPPLDDFRAENFMIQQRNFDRSHSKPDTTYYEVYLPQTVPRSAGKLPCGYFRNYRIETSTWTVAVEPLNC